MRRRGWFFAAFLRNCVMLSKSRKRDCSGSSGGGSGTPGSRPRISDTIRAISPAPEPNSDMSAAGSRSWM